MALRDKITAVLDQSVPVKERTVEVVATSPGGIVSMDMREPFVVLEEKTRGGKVKTWAKVHKDHVVRVVFVNAK